MRKYVVLNKFGRVCGVSDSLTPIATYLGVHYQTLRNRVDAGKPIRDHLVMPTSKHEYLWHKHGGRRGGDDYFAFCTPEELHSFKETEKRTYLDICDKYKPMRL